MTTNQSARVVQIPVGPMLNFAYLIADPSSGEAAVVDPGWEAEKILKAAEAEGWRLTAAIATHNHFDHVGAVPELLKMAGVPVYANQADAPEIAAGKNLRPMSDGDVVKIGQVEIALMQTPGHTAGSQCLRVGKNLFTGDTLFLNTCGRVDLPTSDPKQMYESLKKLARLPADTMIWPGHLYSEELRAALAEVLKDNPMIKICAQGRLEDFLALVS